MNPNPATNIVSCGDHKLPAVSRKMYIKLQTGLAS